MTATGVVVGLCTVVVLCLRRGARVGAVEPDRPPPARRSEPGLQRVPAGRPRRWWASTLDDAAIDGDPAGWARTVVAALVASAVAGAWRGGPIGAVVLVVIGVAAGTLVLRTRRGRRDQEADRRLPEVLELVARGLRSGLDLRSALAAATVEGPHGVAVAQVVDRIDGGASPGVALAGWVDDHPRAPVRVVGAALSVAATVGGRSADSLDGVAASLRARHAASDEASSLATQARASAAVMVALPAVVGGIGAATDPAVAAALLGTTWGLTCLGLAVAFDLAGGWWMHRIVSATEP